METNQLIDPPIGSVVGIAPPVGSIVGPAPQGDLRADGTTKGPGFLGTLKRPDGDVSTELSIGLNDPEFGGKETQIPLLVPGLTEQEINYLLSGKEATPAIIQKAKQYALGRISSGKSPFAQPGEQIAKSPPVGEIVTMDSPMPELSPSGFPSKQIGKFNVEQVPDKTFLQKVGTIAKESLGGWDKASLMAGLKQGVAPFVPLVAPVEGAASVATGFAAFPVASVVGKGAEIIGNLKGDKDAALKGQKAAEAVGQAMTYQPKTEAGKTYSEAVNYIFTPITKLKEFLTDKMEMNPEQAASFGTSFDLLLAAGGAHAKWGKSPLKPFIENAILNRIPIKANALKKVIAEDPAIAPEVKAAVAEIGLPEITPEVADLLDQRLAEMAITSPPERAKSFAELPKEPGGPAARPLLPPRTLITPEPAPVAAPPVTTIEIKGQDGNPLFTIDIKQPEAAKVPETPTTPAEIPPVAEIKPPEVVKPEPVSPAAPVKLEGAEQLTKAEAKDAGYKFVGDSKQKLVNPKEQKAWLLGKIDEATKKAPEIIELGEKDFSDPKLRAITEKRMAKQKESKVVFDVPGDGQFEIINTKNALGDFRSIADKQFPTTKLSAPKSSLPSLAKIPLDKLMTDENYQNMGATNVSKLSDLSRGNQTPKMENKIEPKSEFVSNGHYMIRGFKDRIATKQTGEMTTDYVKKTWDPSILKAKTEVFPSKIYPGYRNPTVSLASANKKLIVHANGSYVADIVTATGADRVMATNESGPLVFYRGKNPVALLMPVKEGALSELPSGVMGPEALADYRKTSLPMDEWLKSRQPQEPSPPALEPPLPPVATEALPIAPKPPLRPGKGAKRAIEEPPPELIPSMDREFEALPRPETEIPPISLEDHKLLADINSGKLDLNKMTPRQKEALKKMGVYEDLGEAKVVPEFIEPETVELTPPTKPDLFAAEAREKGIPAGEDTYFSSGIPVQALYEKVKTKLTEFFKGKPKTEPEAVLERPANVQAIIDALKEGKKGRAAQERSYTKERTERMKAAAQKGKFTSGEAGFNIEKSELAGPYEKLESNPLRLKLTQEKVNELFDSLKNSRKLSFWESVRAREGLSILLGEEGKGGIKIPQESQLALLNRAWGPEFVQAIKANRTGWQKLKSGLMEFANVPRALMASFDLSAPFRQGMVLGFNNPKLFVKAYRQMLSYMKSEKSYKAMMDDMRRQPNYDYASEAGLSLMDIDAGMKLAEEKFMGGKMAEVVPGIRASNRAYTGFLTKLRFDNFNYLFDKADKMGLDPAHNPKLMKDIASMINTASGRGNIKALERAMIPLNTVLFSPRLMISRIQLLNPVYYAKLSPFARRQALKSMFAFTGSAMTVLGLAKLGGAKVEADPRNANFGKIQIGNTRIDVLAGFGQYVRPLAQIISGKVISSTTGKTMTLGEGYKPLTRYDILARSVEMKEAPIASFATTLLRGKTALGEKLNIPAEVANRFIPMIIQDSYELAKEDPTLLPLAAFGAMGFGLQTYSGKDKVEELASKYFEKGDKQAYTDAVEYIKALPKEEQEKAKKKFMFVGKMKDVPEPGYWLTLQSMSPEARAEDFYKKYKDADEKEKKELIATSKKVPGITTDRFKERFMELLKSEKEVPAPKPRRKVMVFK